MRSLVSLTVTMLLLVSPCTCGSPKQTPMTKYMVEVYTRDVDGGGTDANVYIQIVRSKHTTKPILLDTPEDNYIRGRTDRFNITVEEGGVLLAFKLRIPYRQILWKSRNWAVGKRSVTDLTKGTKVECKNHRWIDFMNFSSLICSGD